MQRPWHIAAAFGASLVLLLAATAWMSWTTLRLDRAEAEARAQAALEENIRLALWRMDSALAPLIAQERARPYFVYTAFYPAEAAYARMFSDLELGEVLIPSPLLTPPAPYVLLHFQLDEAGAATSPEVPTGRLQKPALAYVTAEQIDAARQRLAELHERVAFGTLLAALPPPVDVGRPTLAPLTPQVAVQTPMPQQQEQSARNSAEYQARAQQFQQRMAQPNVNNAFVTPSAGVREGVFEPRWVNGQLLLARRVAVNETEYVQGLWLDWTALRAELLNSVADLLPGAQLEPGIDGGAGGTHQRLLAGLPIRLIASTPAVAAAPGRPALWLPLLLAWGCVILATVAVGALLAGTVALSERRAAFASAVTHELRTPLTTFRLYSEMLATGMVTDDATRTRYFETLHGEAVRLSHLVENVLAYARLERRRIPTPCAPLRVAELI